MGSTHAAALVRRVNGDSGRVDTWAEVFPPRHRPALALALLGVTLAAIAVRAPFLGTAFTAPDTDQYLHVAQGVFHGGYSSNLRPPGYPTLLAIFELFGGDPVAAVVTFQNLVGIVLPAFVLLAAWRFFSPAVGIVAAFLAAASPLAIAVEQFALSDYLFGVLILAAAVVLAETVLRTRNGRSPWQLLVLTGVLFGLATMLRANGLYGLIAIPATLLLTARPWKPVLRSAGLALAAMVVVIAPWCIHNLIRFGDPNVASESGISLYARAISYDEVPPSEDTEDGRLALSVYNTANPDRQEAAVGTTLGTYSALVYQTDKDSIEAAAAMGQIARDAILREPWRYLERSLEILGRYQSVFDPQTFRADPQDQIATTRSYIGDLDPSARAAPGDSSWTRVLWQIAQTLSKLLFVVTVGGLLLLALPFLGARRSRLAASVFLVVGFLDILGTTLTARFEIRHVIVLAPIVWILATATAGLLVSLVMAALRRRPPLRTDARAQGASA